ncbi:MAG: DUF1778 domain-containing protein, partial [Mesorhizobium sp.]
MKAKLPDKARKSLSVARIEPREVIERTLITVTPAAYAQFDVQLDAPPKPNERLRKTMNALCLGRMNNNLATKPPYFTELVTVRSRAPGSRLLPASAPMIRR